MTVFLTFPTNGHPQSWQLTREQVAEWVELYPGLDVEAECRKALAWIKANRRKTSRGMPRFLVGWLNRANDAPKTAPIKPKLPPPLPKPDEKERKSIERRAQLYAEAKKQGLGEAEARKISYQRWLSEGHVNGGVR